MNEIPIPVIILLISWVALTCTMAVVCMRVLAFVFLEAQNKPAAAQGE